MSHEDGASSDAPKKKRKARGLVASLLVFVVVVITQVIPTADANWNFYDRVVGYFRSGTTPEPVASKGLTRKIDSSGLNDSSDESWAAEPVRITNGTTLDYLRQKLGPSPRIVRCGSNGFFESHFYRFPDRDVQLVFSPDRSLSAYAVTAVDRSTAIQMPVLQGLLGTKSYQDLVPNFEDSVPLHYSMSSKAFYYTERHWLGNPGKFRSIYVGFNSRGADLTPGGTVLSNPDSLEVMATARLNHPNTFGMSSQYFGSEDEDPFFQCGFGHDQIDLDLPIADVEVSFDSQSFY